MPDSENSSVNPSVISDLDDLNTIAGLRKGAVVLGRFKLERCLGRGGMGEVWLAHDRTLEEQLALKLLPRLIHFDERAVDDLKNETRRGRQLSHPNIVRVFDFYKDDENVGIAMEYVGGENLSALHAREPHGVFTADKITNWTRQLLQGLDYAHRTEKVVHRDLKPANLLVDQASGNLKIADFGIARCLADSMQRVTVSAQSRGTLCYMSPEQAMGRGANPLDDIYAVGATLYQLLAGTPPFYSGDVFNQILKVPPPPIGERQREQGFNVPPPPQWEMAIMRCLSKERADRPQSALEVLDLLGLRTGDMPAPLPYTLRDGGAAPGVVVSSPHPGHTMPPAATLPIPTHTGVGTSTIAVSTSAPVVTVLPGATRTIDLTRTIGGQQTQTASKPGTSQDGGTKDKPAFPWKIVAAAAVVVLGGVGAFLAYQHSTPPVVVVPPPPGDVPLPPVVPPGPQGVPPVIPPVVPPSVPPSVPTAKEWRVPGHFPTIQAAIDAAKTPGQIIHLGDQVWNEKISIKNSVQLMGTDPKKCVISVDGRGGAALEVRGIKDVVIKGIGFAHSGDEMLAGGHSAVSVENSEVSFESCSFTRGMKDGMTVSGASKVKTTKCIFLENTDAGVKATAAASIEAVDCTFEKNNFGVVSELADSSVTLTGGSFTGQAASGIVASDQGRVSVKKASFTNNKENAVFAHDSGSSITLDDCDLVKSDYGIKVAKGAGLKATKCRLRENLTGVGLDNPGNVELRESTIEASVEDGLVLFADNKSGSVLIYGNTIKGNNRFGMNIHGAGMIPDVSGNDFGPNAFPDIYLHGKAAGSYSKNTLRSAERFVAETAGPDDPGAGAYQWATDNVEKPGQ
ncbi:MAG: hypothetical protein RIS79_3776 [Verrucomicrobiota bacterium]